MAAQFNDLIIAFQMKNYFNTNPLDAPLHGITTFFNTTYLNSKYNLCQWIYVNLPHTFSHFKNIIQQHSSSADLLPFNIQDLIVKFTLYD